MTSDAEGSASAAVPPPPPPSHYLAKCILRGSAVLHSVQGRFRSPSSSDVIFGKETSLELVEIGEDGIPQTICEQTVFGIIKDLAVLKWNERYYESIPQAQGRDVLVVLSDSGKLSFLSFSPEMHRFFAVTHIELSEPGNLRHQVGRMIAVDPEGSFIAVSAHEDRFAIFSLAPTAGSSFINDKIFYPPEIEDPTCPRCTRYIKGVRGTIWSMCFISSSTNYLSTEGYHPILAVVMHRKGSSGNELLLFGYNCKIHVIQIISRYSEAGHLALSISAVPRFSGFAFLFRVGDLLLMDLRNPEIIRCIRKINLTLTLLSPIEERNFVVDISKRTDIDDEVMFDEAACALLELRDSGDDTVEEFDPMNIDSGNGSNNKEIQNTRYICSYSWEPATRTCSKLVFCLDTGDLYIMEVNFDIEGIRVSLSGCLYLGQPCKSLLWMQGGLIAGFVEMGDGFVLKLEKSGLAYKSCIQNIAPILDLAVADCHNEKQNQVFACCGMKPEGSLRVIRSGISVEKLLKTSPIYRGVSGTWTLKMNETDTYNSFLVLSFVEETRVLSVGLSFSDVSDAMGFQPDACTLACGLVANGSLVQIHKIGVRLCLPTILAHPEGVPLSGPICTSWNPPNKVNISVGAVGRNVITIATSNPSFLYILGIRSLSAYHYEIYEVQNVKLPYEVSCMSIPQDSKVVVIGTHKPSVEILSLEPREDFRVLAVGLITVNNALGCPISGCIPENVRLVSVDRVYVLSGLRNGMLLRFEWTKLCFLSHPSSSLSHIEKLMPAILEMIAVRRIGIMPVNLVPLNESPNSDIIVLSDRPWLLHVARHSLAYTSVSFQTASHVTPVCSAECPTGILFVAENCLHLVEMVQSKRLNVQRFSIGGTPRKILYHTESKTLFVLRAGLSGYSCTSDICRVDPLSGSILSKFKCEQGETAKCMRLFKVGNEELLLVGTSLSPGRPIMPSGEAESGKGRVIVLSLDGMQTGTSQTGSPFHEISGYSTEEGSPSNSSRIQIEEIGVGQLRMVSQVMLPGAVLAICPYNNRYFLASAGNVLNVFTFVNENPHRLRKLASSRTRFAITCLNSYLDRISVGDCRDGILFYSYQEEHKKLDLEYSDPAQRLVADCALMDCGTAIVSDRHGGISILSTPKSLEAYESPEKNLNINCSFYMGETVMSIQKASFSYKLPVDDEINGDGTERVLESTYNSVIASTLLGSVFIMIPLSREEHELLAAVQDRLASHRLTSPVLGNDHQEFRARGSSAGVPTILDGDLLVQVLELTSLQQEAILMSSGGQSTDSPLSVNRVVQTLERVHYALN